MLLEEVVDAYLGEWLRGLPPPEADKSWYLESFKNFEILEYAKGGLNWISHAGNRHLSVAARLLLERMGEQRRITLQTARRCLIEAHFAHLPKARKTGKLSEHAVIAGASKKITHWKRSPGSYVFPACFAPSATKSQFRIGPAVVFAKATFEEKYLPAIAAQATDEFGRRAVTEWSSYAERYDHFVVVDIERHETKMAWIEAREVAEYVLNLIRMKFGFSHMDDVRIGNGLVWETKWVQVHFDKSGAAGFSLSSGRWASHLDDTWVKHFDDDFGIEAPLLASLATWMASGDHPHSPVLERLRYANTLIAEAFSEPHDHIRLVRLVAALEALAVLPREEKSDSLAWRCALAGGWTDCGRAVQIVDDVLYAYTVRNALVHGDSPGNEEAISAFYRLERHLVRTYLGFLHLYAKIQQRYRPTQSVIFAGPLINTLRVYFGIQTRSGDQSCRAQADCRSRLLQKLSKHLAIKIIRQIESLACGHVASCLRRRVHDIEGLPA